MSQKEAIYDEVLEKQFEYLTARIVRLLYLVKKDWFSKYFTIDLEGKPFNLLERTTILTRAMLLYEELLSEILPQIKRRLSFSAERTEEEHKTLAGAICWNKTLKNFWQRREGNTPVRFTCKIPFKQFEEPENILAVMSVLGMQHDCFNLLTRYLLREKLVDEEKGILARIVSGCNKVLEASCFRDLTKKAREYLALEENSTELLRLEREAETKIRSSIRTNKGYVKLLDWRKRYKKLNLESSGEKRNFPSIQGKYDVNKMYELWILLEIVHYLSHTKNAEVRVDEFPNRFSATFEEQELEIYYQRSADIIPAGWIVGGIPDFVIRYGKEKGQGIILDAKNYAVSSKTQATFKMLGYLNNFHLKHGILFFPEASVEEPSFDIKQDQMYMTGQSVSWITLHPSDRKEFVESKTRNFEALFKYVVNIKD